MAQSGQITITSAGTAVQGPDEVGAMFALAAHPDNSGTVWVGNEGGDVSSSNGYPLTTSGPPVVMQIANINQIWADAETDGDIVCWIKLS